MTRLGKGLSALIKEDIESTSSSGNITKLKIGLIQPNEYQPRRILTKKSCKTWLNQ